MKTDFGVRFAGGAFVAAGLMTALGWLLLPVQCGVAESILIHRECRLQVEA